MLVAAALVSSLLAISGPVTVKNRRLEAKQTVGTALYAHLDEQTASAALGALKAAEFDFRHARAGDQLRFVFQNGQLEVLDYRRNLFNEWQVRREGDRYVGKRQELEREQRVEVVELNVESSVWDAAIAAGEKPDIAVTLSDVFAWDIDFYRDVQKGDRMRAVVEKVLHKGRVIDYGDVLAAEYVGSSVGRKTSYRFQLPDGKASYFTEDGESARKTFLKSPLKFAHITSRFGGRFHPVLQYTRAHNGVDYGTPTGTPVWSVADGTVTTAGYDRGNGNHVCVRHAMSFETCYLHLSKIKVKRGQKLAQKAVLGDSGNTGLSTGPHLHFGMKRGGKWVNPLNQNFPRAEPLPRDQLPEFEEQVEELRPLLEAQPVALGQP